MSDSLTVVYRKIITRENLSFILVFLLQKLDKESEQNPDKKCYLPITIWRLNEPT